jgi:hypothetical protein
MNCRWVLIALVLAVSASSAPADGGDNRSDDNRSGGGKLDARDERFRRLAVGTWEDDYQGKRTMTLRQDGKGTMLVELSGVRAKLFAERLKFDMVWSVEQGRLKKRTIGGEPAVAVQLILKTMGDRVDERILELTDDRLLLQDKDGKTKYDWRRKRLEQEPQTRGELP